MISITDKKNCTGCSACVSVCPKQCISMQLDNEGFRYPIVNTQDCIHCDLCEKICPVTNSVVESRKPHKTLAVVSNKEEERMVSSSGGTFSLLASSIIAEGGIVFGAAFDDNWHVVHQGIEVVDELWRLRGAKYVQSDLGQSFKEVRKCLIEGRKVLFSGTPCQIAGLKKFLRKEYEHLFTVDLICHGVPSSKVFHRFLQDHFEGKKIVDLSFRNKSTGWRTYNLSVKYSNNNDVVEKKFLREDNIFMEGFISNLYLRPSCYQCPAKSGKSGSDITLGDFWGIEKFAPEMDDQKGTSLVLLNTSKGLQLFEDVDKNVRYKEMSYQQALEGNASLEKSSSLNPWRAVFFSDFEKKPFSVLLRSFDMPSLSLRIRRILYKYIRKE